MNCELCGRESELYDAIIESIELAVCRDCSRFGKVLGKKEVREEEEIKKPAAIKHEDIKEKDMIVEDYGDIVKKAREKRQMTQEDLAKAIAEKESIIHKIESGQMMPQMKTAKKLEQFLRIKLVADHNGGNEHIRVNFRDNTLTIGDLVKLKK
ncbi:TIGR00270 family protein [Candidatus Woesearchaeota archaeon]|nr:TIGR00270 family protein [Candidatus Woesearchaeota archaeon]